MRNEVGVAQCQGGLLVGDSVGLRIEECEDAADVLRLVQGVRADNLADQLEHDQLKHISIACHLWRWRRRANSGYVCSDVQTSSGPPCDKNADGGGGRCCQAQHLIEVVREESRSTVLSTMEKHEKCVPLSGSV